jgi:hypothetical protein
VSGTGKSTHTSNWLKYIPETDLMNDDNPVVRVCTDGVARVFGSPWSGKTPCYRNVRTPLGAIVMIKRDNHNEMIPQSALESFVTVLSACSAMKWDEELYTHVCRICSKFVETIQVTELHCLPDAESALTACSYLTRS